MGTMEHRVRQFIEEHGLICQGDTVVAGVSGGADSLCLFLILYELAAEMEFGLHVVHVHHGLRLSAQRDLEFVEELCGQMRVPCTVVRVDAAECARQWGTGVEEAGRMLRYDAFRQVCEQLEQQDCVRETGCMDRLFEHPFCDRNTGQDGENEKNEKRSHCRIAVAHHREDQAETVLFHLCRGTDLRGARGMLPVNGQIIRPLLCESRSSIEQYLMERGIAWREDETNTDTAYTRNYLRREILPRLEDGVHAAAAERIAQFASVCTRAEEYLSKVTDQAAGRCLSECTPADRILLPEGLTCLYILRIDTLGQEDPYLQGRILYRCLVQSTVSGRDIGAVHVDALHSLCSKKTDGRVSMPSGVTVLRSAGKLYFCRKTEETAPVINPAPGKRGPSEEGRYFPLSEEDYECYLRDFDGGMAAIPRNEYTKWFDYDKIGTFPVFRTRKPGDCMILFADPKTRPETCGADIVQPDCSDVSGESAVRRTGGTDTLQEDYCGASGEKRKTITKKLARIMLDGKIPAGVRDKIVLPFSGKEALWIPGLRMGDSCRVTPETTRILEIRWHINDKDPGDPTAHNIYRNI